MDTQSSPVEVIDAAVILRRVEKIHPILRSHAEELTLPAAEPSRSRCAALGRSVSDGDAESLGRCRA